MTWRGSLSATGLLIAGLGCHTYSTRPGFPPITGAPFAELNLPVSKATGIVAQALRDDTLPVSLAEPKDGLIETPWFNASTLAPTNARRLGPNVVQVRAWVDPTKPGSSRVTIETVYRPLADPSLPPRELDRLVPPDHPVGKRIGDLVIDLAKTYGTPPSDSVTATPFGIPEADSTADSLKSKP